METQEWISYMMMLVVELKKEVAMVLALVFMIGAI